MTNENETVEVEETLETPEVEEKEEKVDKNFEEIATNQKKRAEKAEADAKELRKQLEEAKDQSSLSQMDVIALAKADIHEEDLDTVTQFAQMKGVSVKDAIADNDVKAILERRTEVRKAAAASNTGSGKASAPAMDGEALAREAQRGNLPEKTEDLEKMWDAQSGVK